MERTLLGGNSPDRTPRFVEELHGRRRSAGFGLPEKEQQVVLVKRQLPFTLRLDDLERLPVPRLREIAVELHINTLTEDSRKGDIAVAILRTLEAL